MPVACALGGDKSTLIEILAGLYQPTEGEVLIDGQPLSRWNAQSLRSEIALVAQDDSLLQGTIAENISGFDEQTDMQLVLSQRHHASRRRDPQTLRAAERVITLEGGVAREAGSVLHQQQEMME